MRRWVLAAVGLALSGCLEISQSVRLEADGSGRLTEVVRVDDRVIQAAKATSNPAGLEDFLSRKAVEARLDLYGKVTLVSHDVKDLGSRGKEATLVLAFKSIDELTIPAWPSRASNWSRQKVCFKLGEPQTVHEIWSNSYYTVRPLNISLSPASSDTPGGKDDLTPAQAEDIRRQIPLVRDMIKGLRINAQIEAFAPINRRSGPHVLYSISDRDIKDDETLKTLLLWHLYPDKTTAAFNRGSPYGQIGDWQLLSGAYTANITMRTASGPAPATAPAPATQPVKVPPARMR